MSAESFITLDRTTDSTPSEPVEINKYKIQFMSPYLSNSGGLTRIYLDCREYIDVLQTIDEIKARM